MADRAPLEGKTQPAVPSIVPPSSPPEGATARVDTSGPTWQRLVEQIDWYDRKSIAAQRWFKRLKLVELVAAASLPPIVGFRTPGWIAAVMASLIVVLEGCQHLYQWHDHWNNYRSTCEALRHEQYLFLAGAGDYATAPNPTALLAERIEGLVSQEHAKWTASQQSTIDRAGDRQAPS
jgi:hypothetical protein